MKGECVTSIVDVEWKEGGGDSMNKQRTVETGTTCTVPVLVLYSTTIEAKDGKSGNRIRLKTLIFYGTMMILFTPTPSSVLHQHSGGTETELKENRMDDSQTE